MNLGAVLSLLQLALALLVSSQSPSVSTEVRQQAVDFSYQAIEIATQAISDLTLPKINEDGNVLSVPFISPQLSGVQQPFSPPPTLSAEARVIHIGPSGAITRTIKPLEYWIKGCNANGCYNPDPQSFWDKVEFIIRVENYIPGSGVLSCLKIGDWSGETRHNSWVQEFITKPGSYGVECSHNGEKIFSDFFDINVIYRETTN